MLKDGVALLAEVIKPFRVVASLNIVPSFGVAYSCLGSKISKVSISM